MWFEVTLPVCIIYLNKRIIREYMFISYSHQSCVESYKNVLRSDEEHEENNEGEASVCSDATTVVTCG